MVARFTSQSSVGSLNRSCREASSIVPPLLSARAYSDSRLAAHCGLHAATGQRAYDSFCRSLNSTALLAQPCYRLLPGSSVLPFLAPCNGSRFDLRFPLETRSESTPASETLRCRVRQVCNMSGSIDWVAGQREFAAFCNSSCSPTPLTTAYGQPDSRPFIWRYWRVHSLVDQERDGHCLRPNAMDPRLPELSRYR